MAVKLFGFAISILLVASASASAPVAAHPTGAPEIAAVSTLSEITAADRAGTSLDPAWHHGAFMEIFVRSYRDTDGDGIGDLRGVTASLDYLQRLGVRGIWLMPVTRSQDGDHGYAVADYRQIEPAYGTLADFDELLAQAHARGIGVIIDYVINHSAATHPAFVAASGAVDSPYRDWYMMLPTAPAGWNIFGKDPWVPMATGVYLAQFSPTMPDFNLRNPDALEYHKRNLRYWLDRGVDGFRFDAVVHLIENGPNAWRDQPENRALMQQLRAVVDAYPNRYIVCEAASNAIAYAADTACGSAFALEQARDIVAAAGGSRSAIRAVAAQMDQAAAMAGMVSNHDLFAGERLWDQVDGDAARYRLAAATYLLQPGTPFIYYGEEVGMSAAAGLQGDPKLRTPMSWRPDATTAGFSSVKPYRVPSANVLRNNAQTQATSEDSLLAYYAALLALRNDFLSIARGMVDEVSVTNRTLGYRRHIGDEQVWVFINYAKRPERVGLRASHLHALRQIFPQRPLTSPVADGNGQLTVLVPAQSTLVFATQPAGAGTAE